MLQGFNGSYTIGATLDENWSKTGRVFQGRCAKLVRQPNVLFVFDERKIPPQKQELGQLDHFSKIIHLISVFLWVVIGLDQLS